MAPFRKEIDEMVKEVKLCEFREIPTNSLTRCRAVAEVYCQGNHAAKTFYCWYHLQQHRECGKILCPECLREHSLVCEARQIAQVEMD